MHAVRQKKLIFVLMGLLVLAVVAGLLMYALRQNISLFYTPSQIIAGEVKKGQLIRAGGMVVKGSIKREADSLKVSFQVTDLKQTITIVYQGILPDLFREGQGVVVTGHLLDNQQVQAQEVLAKHDENYMPPEVKSSLATSQFSSKAD